MARISLQRQTYLVIGTLVLVGLALGWWVSSWFYLLTAFVGAGMITAGSFGVCTMTRMLAKLPGNPRHSGRITRDAPG